MNYYQKNIKDIFKIIETSDKGLTSKEVDLRLKKYGLNELKEKKKISPVKIFLNQFNSIIIWVLIGAIILSLIVGERIDSMVIGVIVILNAIFGFIQEYKAEKSIEALRKMAHPKAKVIRNGKEIEINSNQIVPGDIIILQEGDRVPADARLIQAENLDIDEAALTGESLPVKKTTNIITKKVGIGDQKNMVFSGTMITRGFGKAIVVKTAMETEIGKIAKMIQETETKKTPLQEKLAKLGKTLSIATLAICIVVFFIYFLKDKTNVIEPLMMAISLAVAAIPEGLPAVVTISLALGVKRMIKGNVLMRKLPSVETLGCTTVICSDKTGTLTHNEMTVKKVYVDKEVIEVGGEGYNINGEFSKKTKDLDLLLRCGLLCNDSFIDKGKPIGDPTEAALIISANKLAMKKVELEKNFKRIKGIAFDSERKRMSTLYKSREGYILFTKGAPDVVLELCTNIIENGKSRKITNQDKKEILAQNDKFANDALRVLGFAFKHSSNTDEKSLTFIGLQAMKDPPRQTVKSDIALCHKAGIKVIMITGDHKLTAQAIAKEIGIVGKVITGDEIPDNLDNIVEDIAVYARVNPEHKMKIIEALKKKGHIVAMTGDGVNDAPALKNADIGIAMGIKGTEVSKEAADMILTDDSFTSIVNAIKEGRGIYNNIKKFVNYLLSSNAGEIFLILFASLMGLPLPLIAIQILWVNLVTDGLPALALGVDPISPDVMKKKPRNPKENIVNKNMAMKILFMGLLIGVFSLFLFKRFIADLALARTVAFTALVVFELARIYTIRSEYKVGIFSNKYLIGAILTSIMLQLAVVYTPLSIFFKTVPLGLIEWGYILGATLMILVLGLISIPLIRKITHQQD